MSTFTVIEIINGFTFKTLPKWAVKVPQSSTNPEGEVTGSVVIIKGLSISENDEYAKKRLSTLLYMKEVDLSNPTVTDFKNIEDGIVSCNVFLEKTDITYYFPEFVKKNTQHSS